MKNYSISSLMEVHVLLITLPMAIISYLSYKPFQFTIHLSLSDFIIRSILPGFYSVIMQSF